LFVIWFVLLTLSCTMASYSAAIFEDVGHYLAELVDP